MKNKKILIIIPIVVILAIILAFILVRNGDNARQDAELTEQAKTIQKYTPDKSIDEIKDVLNQPVTPNEQEYIDSLHPDIETIPEAEVTPPDEFEFPDEIPNNVILQQDANGNYYYLEVYPPEYNSLEEYEAAVEQQLEEIEKQEPSTYNNNSQDVSPDEDIYYNGPEEDLPDIEPTGREIYIDPNKDYSTHLNDPNGDYTDNNDYSDLTGLAG